jgi:predicted CoA-binding protein
VLVAESVVWQKVNNLLTHCYTVATVCISPKPECVCVCVRSCFHDKVLDLSPVQPAELHTCAFLDIILKYLNIGVIGLH